MTEDQIAIITRAAEKVIQQGVRAAHSVNGGCVYENKLGHRCIVGHILAEVRPDVPLLGLSYENGLSLAQAATGLSNYALIDLQIYHDQPAHAHKALARLDPAIEPIITKMIDTLKTKQGVGQHD